MEFSRSQLCWGSLGCVGALFIHLVIGSMWQWGIVNIYVTSYYRTSNPDVNLEDNAIAFPIMMICIGLTMRLGLYLSEVTHPLFIMALNVLLKAACMFTSSYIKSMGWFIVFYGVIFGLICGNQYMVPIVECNKYFPGKKMYVNAVILMGTGVGSLVFGLFSFNFLNPQRVKPIDGYYVGTDEVEDIVKKLPECLRYLALLYLCIGSIGVLMISKVAIDNRLEEKKLKEKKDEEI